MIFRKSKIKLLLFTSLFLLLLPSLHLFAVENLAVVVAVVGNELITEGELNEQFQFLLLSGFIRPEDSLKVDSLKLDLLTQLINRRVLIEYAQKESLEVTVEEIDELLERALEDMKSQFPDEEAFNSKLEEEGLSLKTFKENYRKQIKENLLLQKLIQQEFGSEMFVTEKEIEDFYTVNRDSFAEPLKVELAHIFILPKPSKNEEVRIQEIINEVFLRLEFNEDFGELASKFSDGKLKNKGGDLGFVTKEELPSEIAEIAFSLKVDELTIAQGRDGFHLLKCVGKRDNKIHLKRILFKVKITSLDTLRAQRFAQNLKKRTEEGEDFSRLVKKYSDDIETKENGGNIGEIFIEQLNPLFKDAIKDLDEGGISEPVKTEIGFHIFKILRRPEQKIPELDEISHIVKDFIIQKRTKEKTDELLERILPNFYVENILKKNLSKEK
ncbi:peptidylprolyl isomerase [candidate division WOR-3 bacterium]|nr:peptidylprolyl isomerase [candidate division WOR-3 bacterium]